MANALDWSAIALVAGDSTGPSVAIAQCERCGALRVGSSGTEGVVYGESDGETPIEPVDGFGRIRVNVPGASNAEAVGAVLRAFGALIEVEGGVMVTIEARE